MKRSGEQKFYSFKDLLSGSGGDEGKPTEQNDQRYPVVNVPVAQDKGKIITAEEKEGYRKINLFKEKKIKEKPYTRSEEYRNYLKVPNPKENELLIKTRMHILDKLLTLQDKNDTGASQQLFKPEEIKTIEQQNDATMSLTPMAEKTEPTNQVFEKKALSAEDLDLQKKVQGEMSNWRNILAEEEREVIKKGDEIEKRWIENKLRSFESSPYGWIQNALESSLRGLEKALENPENKDFKKEISLRIAKVRIRISNIIDSYEKKIPLKLDRNDRTKDFRPDEGLVFDSANTIGILNRYLKENSKAYVVGDAFQRGPAQYVILKTDTGVEKEINIEKLDEILSEASSRDEHINKIIQEKLVKFEKIKSGDIVETRIGGFKGKETIYKIHEVKDGKVMYENLTENQKVTVSIDDMRKFLMNKGTEFIVHEDRKATVRVAPSPIKNQDKPPASEPIIITTKTTPENIEGVLPTLADVTAKAQDLGFMNALVIARDFKLSKEEAEKLFSEYEVFKASEPATEPVATVAEADEPAQTVADETSEPIASTVEGDVKVAEAVGGVVGQEPAQEKQGPTSEQIARFENLLMKGKEFDEQIKALEEKIQKDLEN